MNSKHFYGQTFFQNHSSIIHKYYKDNISRYILTDPWFDSPAFGSWLPSFPPSLNKEHIIALAMDGRLDVLISHAHDDHCDNLFLEMFPTNTKIVIPKFKSPGLKRRLIKLGLTNISEIDTVGHDINGVYYRSFINAKLSLDDAIVTIETEAEALIHNNDNWFQYDDETASEISKIVNKYGNRVLFMSQTNSASGFPFTYQNLTLEEKIQLNYQKVKKMIQGGVSNCIKVNANNFLSYAGYAAIYVEGNDQYRECSINPTPKWIKEHIEPCGVNVVDMLPGDIYNFDNNSVTEHFMKESLECESYSKARDIVYEVTGLISKCDTYDAPHIVNLKSINENLDYFLNGLNRFVMERISTTEFFEDIIGKIFSVKVENSDIKTSVLFGKGIVDFKSGANKVMTVKPFIIQEVLSGNILFENLYTGYEAKWERESEYNRDIIMGLVMYSYFYKNVLSSQRPFQ